MRSSAKSTGFLQVMPQVRSTQAARRRYHMLWRDTKETHVKFFMPSSSRLQRMGILVKLLKIPLSHQLNRHLFARPQQECSCPLIEKHVHAVECLRPGSLCLFH